MTYFIPANLDLDKLLSEHIPSIKNFKKQYLLYIIDLITTIAANNKDLINTKGFIPINAALLQKKIRNYKEYINYLIESGIIETDNRYVSGEKSKGYKFTNHYLGIINAYSFNSKDEKKRRNGLMNLSIEQRKKYDHLVKWFDDKLEIDKQAALAFIESDLQNKLASPESKNWNELTRTYKNPVKQYNHALLNIEKFSSRSFSLSIDDFGFRLHTPLTNISSDLRNFITYNDLRLVSIDIANCQPYLSILLFNPAFWEGTHDLNLNSLSLDYTNIFNSYSSFSSFIILCKSYGKDINSDLQEYINNAASGTFYQHIETNIKKAANKKELKAIVFQTLFTDNRFLGQVEAEPKRKFKQLFPTVYEIISLIKRTNKNNLPLLLQRIESYLILQLITRYIAFEYPELPIFTIHDSIVTIEGQEDSIKSIATKMLRELVGKTPKFSIEHWHPKKLKKQMHIVL